MIKKNIILLLVFIVATLLSEIVSANKTIDESSWHKYVVSRVIDNFIKINSKDLNLQSQKTDAHITFTVLLFLVGVIPTNTRTHPFSMDFK